MHVIFNTSRRRFEMRDAVAQIGQAAVYSGDVSEAQLLLSDLGDPPSGVLGIAAGHVTSWGGKWILRANQLINQLERVTRRRVLLHNREECRAEWLVRSGPHEALITFEHAETAPKIFWVTAQADHRWRKLPRELECRLRHAGIEVDQIPEGLRRQIIGMVREASSEAIRHERIKGIVETLWESRGCHR